MLGSGHCPFQLSSTYDNINNFEWGNEWYHENSSGLLIQSVSETIQNKVKEQKGWSRSVLLGTLGSSLLGNLLTSKGTIIAGYGTIREGKSQLEQARIFNAALAFN